MYSSDYCSGMKNKYSSLKSKFDAIISSVEQCKVPVEMGIPKVEGLILNGKQLDEGKLSEYKTKLERMKSYLNSLVADCQNEYDKWDKEYKDAKKREENGSATL